MSASSPLLPVFVKLDRRPVLVVGGGGVAASKVDTLRPTGARVTVVAPRISPALRRDRHVRLVERRFRASDLNDAWFVVSAATPAVNRQVARAAAARRMLVNAVDDPPNASAYLGGIVRRSGVTIAVSTSGRAPAVSGLLREGLDALLPHDLESWLTVSDRLRASWRSSGLPIDARRPALLEALNRLRPRARHGRSTPAPGGRGQVVLVGAGPGDPDLLTIRALRHLERADLVLHDGLVPESIVRLAARADRIPVARRAGPKRLTQPAVNAEMVAAARRGLRVVRLKSGDPFVFGRGGEEAAALARAGIPVEVVPGLSTATAASTLAGIPVTHRGTSAAFLVVSGHARSAYAPSLRALPPGSATVVVLMGLARRRRVSRLLLDAGWDRHTPAAVLCDVSRPSQEIWTGALGDLATAAVGRATGAAAVIVIGAVAATTAITERRRHGRA